MRAVVEDEGNRIFNSTLRILFDELQAKVSKNNEMLKLKLHLMKNARCIDPFRMKGNP